MQSEEFDKKIREAASHHHPAYDEKAWNKMEKLLDKHLPQEKKDRRRFIFFLLFFLLLGGSTLLFIGNPGKNKKPDNTADNNKPVFMHTDSVINKPLKNPGSEIVLPSGQDTNEKVEKGFKKYEISAPSESAKRNTRKTHHLSGIKKENSAPSNIAVRRKNNKVPNSTEDRFYKNGEVIIPVKDELPITHTNKKPSDKRESVKVESEKEDNENKNITITVNQSMPIKQSKEDDTIQSLVLDNNSNTLTVNGGGKEKTGKIQNRKMNFFFISFSFSPDVSFTAKGQPGTMKVLGGVGVGYTFTNRVTLRTGFYSGRKVYSAAPDAYNPPAIFWNYYPFLEKVNADCKVYEIPLSLSYNFGKPSSRQWFVAGGISSLIMKKEEYYYTYKYTPAGSTHYKEWTVENKNKHYFSVATISGGIQQNIGKSISLTAEPYVKIPLAGVGYGKVKLFSTGIQFTIAAKPFQPKNNTVK
jgi:hypothetical protein